MSTRTPEVKLTKQVVEKAPFAADPKRPVVIRDKDIGGFYLKVGGATKTFVLQRDVWKEGKRAGTRHHTLGRYTGDERGITCEAARREALRIISEPAKLEREGMTLRTAWERYKDSHAKDKGEERAEKTQRRYEQIFTAGYLDSWMDRPLRSITRDECLNRHKELTKEVAAGKYAGDKAGRRRGDRVTGKTTANDIFRVLRAIFARELRLGKDAELALNPCMAVEWHKVTRQRTAIATPDLAKWYAAVMEISNPIRRDYMLFMLFTGMRREAAANVRWTDINWKTRSLHIPNPKGGEGRSFDVPLSDFLIKLLKGRQADNPRRAAEQVFPDAQHSLQWVFPSHGRTGHISEPPIIEADGTRWTAHDLRRTFISQADKIDISKYKIKALVNHAQPSDDDTGRYINIELDDLREPMQQITNQLKKACGAALKHF